MSESESSGTTESFVCVPQESYVMVKMVIINQKINYFKLVNNLNIHGYF